MPRGIARGGAAISQSVCVFPDTQRCLESHYSRHFSLDWGHRRKWRAPFRKAAEKPMTTRRARTGSLLAMRTEAGKQVDRIPASRFPVQHEIQHLQNELNAFNDRIIELENEGHRSYAMNITKNKPSMNDGEFC